VNADGSEKREISFARDSSASDPRLAGWSSDSRHILIWLGGFSESIAADGLALVSVSVENGTVQALTRNEAIGEEHHPQVQFACQSCQTGS